MLITSEHYQHEDENREKLTGEVKPAPGTKAALELEHRSRNESTIEVKVKPTLDPDVEILLFHGRDVRAHIEGLVDEWFEEGSGERSTVSDAIDEALAEYIDGAWSIEFPTQRLHVGPPDEVTFSLRIPLFDGLRAVMCLQVNDLDNKTTTISDPRFITGVGERIVMSDLVPKLFDDQTQTLAKTFSDQLWNNGGELSPETEGLGAQLVEALGTGDIDDVIALLGAG
ncbi:hypothetical protein B5P44_00875 [Mycobacterium sp. CBMA 213]|nr:hypothetical protein [Mycolicibacterium sp. CBMA 213]